MKPALSICRVHLKSALGKAISLKHSALPILKNGWVKELDDSEKGVSNDLSHDCHSYVTKAD